MKRLLQNLALILILAACAAPGQPMAAPSPLAEPATLSTRGPSTDSPASAAVAPTPEATATRLPTAQPTRGTPSAAQPLPQLGKLAFVRDGSVWAMDLPDAEPLRLAPAGKDATLRWSASGQWLAYRYAGGLWVVRRDGRDAHSVADCPLTYAGQPWSPSADELACVGGTWLDVVPVDARGVSGTGSERRRLVTMEASGPGTGISSVAWSPDGKALAYERQDAFGQADGRSGSRASIWRVQADGSGARELVNGGLPSPDRLIVAGWSPDSSHVLYRVNEQFSGSFLADGTTLWSVPATGGTPVQLGGSLASDARPSKEKVLRYTDFLARPPAPSDAAGQLAVTFGGYRSTWMNKRVGLVDAATGQARLLSPANMAATSASWSPDNRFVAYSAMPDTGDLVGGDTARQGMMERRIYIVNTQGDPQPRQLTNDPAYRDELPLWSADTCTAAQCAAVRCKCGTQILFARLDEQARASLWLVPAEGGAPKQVLDGLALDPLSTWFGYYGHIDWQHLFAWWRGPADGLTPASSPAPIPAASPTPGPGLVLACNEIFPGVPGCLREGSLVDGQLAFVETRPAFSGRPSIVDLVHGGHVILGHVPSRLVGWASSGQYLLTAEDHGNLADYAVYQPDGTLVKSYAGLPAAPRWMPEGALPGAVDWLSVPGIDGSLSLELLPGGQTHQVLGTGSLGPGGQATLVWSTDTCSAPNCDAVRCKCGWLAWSPNTDQLAERGSTVQELHLQPAGGGKAGTWTLSQDIRQTYYQLLEWVPGTHLILAAKGHAANSLWSWGVPLATIDANTGQATDLDVPMLLTAESHAWHPTEPGMLAVAAGGSRYLTDESRLTVVDVRSGQKQVLTPKGLSVFEPSWSPDGRLLAYAAVPATPNASGDGATLDQTLQGRAIYVIDPASGQDRKLTEPGDALDGWPQWSADGQKLLYARIKDGHTEVHVIALAGTGDEILLTGLPAGTCYYGGCGWGRLLAYSAAAPP